MPIRSKLIALAVMSIFGATSAWAALSITPQIGGGIGQFDGGVSSSNYTPPPPSSCNGTLDLSTGCATPLPGGF